MIITNISFTNTLFVLVFMSSFIAILLIIFKYGTFQASRRIDMSPIRFIKREYNDFNVNAPLPTCSMYTSTPAPSFASIMPVKDYLQESFGSNIVTLKLRNGGELVYMINDKIIWSSLSPHTYVKCPESALVENAMLSLEWNPVASTNDGSNVKLFLKPFVVTKDDSIIWSMFGGFQCQNLDTNGQVIMISPKRHDRLVLMNSGDLVVLQSSSVKGSQIVSTKLHFSLAQSVV